MLNKASNALADWDNMSLQEKEVVATRLVAEVIEGLYKANDAKGLEVVSNNVQFLADWTKTRATLLSKKLEVITRMNSVLEHLNSKGIDDEFAEAIDSIASITTDFLSDEHEVNMDDLTGYDREETVENIKALMQTEVDKFEAAWASEQKSA